MEKAGDQNVVRSLVKELAQSRFTASPVPSMPKDPSQELYSTPHSARYLKSSIGR